MKNHIYIVFLSFLCFLYSEVTAQEYPKITYTTRDGLSQMQVKHVLEDSRGYIWAGTKGGLSKFDGEYFENFNKNNGYDIREIDQLMEDPQGRIWFTMGYGGVAYFDGAKMVKITPPREKDSNKLPVRWENIAYHNGKYYIGTSSGAYTYQIDGKLEELSVIPSDDSTSTFHRFFCDKKSNTLYFSYLKENKSKVFKCQNDKLELIRSFNGAQLYPIIHHNRIYISILNHLGIGEIYQLEDEKFTLTIEIQNDKSTIIKHLNHDFYFSANYQGYFYDKANRRLEKLETALQPCNTDIVRSSQHSGRVFIGTEKGLICMFNNGFRFFDEKKVPNAWSVTEDRNKNIWIANYSSPLEVFDGKTVRTIEDYYKEFERVYFSKKNATAFSQKTVNNWYFNALADNYGKLWFPNFCGVLVRENKNNKVVDLRTDYFLDGNCFFFHLEKDIKRAKILASGQSGVAVIDMKHTDKYYIIKDTTEFFGKSSLILCSMVDLAGDYWMGAGNVCKYNPKTKDFDYYDLYDGELKKRGVAELMQDAEGHIWAGTFDEGIYLFNTKKERFERVFKNHMMGPGYYLGDYDKHYIITGDNKNLYFLNKKAFFEEGKEVVEVYNHHNGFMGMEPGQQGFFKDSQNRVWITSGSVLSYIDQKKLSIKHSSLRTYIRSINGEMLPLIEKHSNYLLKPEVNKIKLTVESVGTDKSYESQFSFELDESGEWEPWTTSREMVITNLTPGWHLIKVKSKRNNAIDEATPISCIRVYVDLPFYKSPNFYKYAGLMLGCLVLLLSGSFVYSRLQYQKFLKQRKLVERQQRQLRKLQIQTNQAQMNPHFTFNVLSTLQNFILFKTPDETNKQLVNLSNLIRSYLDASILSMDPDGHKTMNIEIELEKEIELLKMYVEFEQLQAQDRFTFELYVDPALDITNHYIPPMLVQPFVENAIKHGLLYLDNPGKLTVSYIAIPQDDDDDGLKIIIEDNGVGMERAKEILSKSKRSYKSRGMQLTLERIEMLNELNYHIQTQIKSSTAGTIITITITEK